MSVSLWQLLVLYLLAANLAAFALMGADKRRARRGSWRLSEKALFLFPCWVGPWEGCWGCGPFTTRRGTGTSAGALPCCWPSSWRA